MGTSSSGEFQKCKPGTIDGSVARSLAHIDLLPDPATPCEICPAGTYAAAGSTGCQDCAVALRGHSDHDFDPGTPCEPCARGRFATTRDGGIQSCVDCAVGRTSTEGTLECAQCTELYYAYATGDDCARCADLALPRRLPPRVDAQDLQAALASSAACRGGVPGTGAFIAPLDGVWIHNGPAGVELLACQSAPRREGVARAGACEGLQAEGNATAWRVKQTAPEQLAAICGEGYTGFLCAFALATRNHSRLLLTAIT